MWTINVRTIIKPNKFCTVLSKSQNEGKSGKCNPDN